MSELKKSLGMFDIIALAFGAMVGWLGLGRFSRGLDFSGGHMGRDVSIHDWWSGRYHDWC